MASGAPLAAAPVVLSGPPLTVALRGKSGVSFVHHEPDAGVHGRSLGDVDDCHDFLYSPDGAVFAALRKDRVSVLSAADLSVVCEVAEENVVAVHFSPLSTKLVTMRKRSGAGDAAREFDDTVGGLFSFDGSAASIYWKWAVYSRAPGETRASARAAAL